MTVNPDDVAHCDALAACRYAIAAITAFRGNDSNGQAAATVGGVHDVGIEGMLAALTATAAHILVAAERYGFPATIYLRELGYQTALAEVQPR